MRKGFLLCKTAEYDRIYHMKKMITATGGTGGHIYPALAFVDTFRKTYPDCEVIFFGSSNRMEAQLIPSKGFRFVGMEMSGMNGGLLAKASSAVSLLKATAKCVSFLKKEKPDLCVGFGNYISVPLIMAARICGIPTMIHEQNSSAGKANRMLGRFADAAAVSYASSVRDFPADKTRITGNPQATLAFEKAAQPEMTEPYGIPAGAPFVLFMLGSLGSSSVSAVIDKALDLFDPDYYILITTGNSNDYTYTHTETDRIRFTEAVDGAVMLKLCSLAVLRAGATTLCEVAAIGTPSVMIPSPFVANNEQYINALDFVRNQAAEVIEEKDLTPELLADTVNRLMKDTQTRELYKKNAAAMGSRDAAYQMTKWCGEIIR